MATLAQSPVMAGEWAGELAGGYGYSPRPSRSLVVVGVFVLIGDSGGWWPASSGMRRWYLRPHPSKGEGRGGSGWSRLTWVTWRLGLLSQLAG